MITHGMFFSEFLFSSLQNAHSDDQILVRSLDRFHRRLQAVEKLMPELGVLR